MAIKEPKTTLVTWTQQPIKAIASQVKNMMGEMVHDLDEISMGEALEILDELKRTELKGALETVDLVFQVEGVPRAFTHQMVRTRVGATYHQESLRFQTREGGFDYHIGPSIKGNETRQTEFEQAMQAVAQAYDALAEDGAETQDARGVLPINVCTKIGYKVNLKTLMHVAHTRLCHQSQPHWFKVVTAMKEQVAEKLHPKLAEFLQPWCQAKGKCGFKAIFDRDCPVEKQLITEICQDCHLSEQCSLSAEGVYCNAITQLMDMEV